MKKLKLNIRSFFWIVLLIVVASSCVKDPYEDVVSNEKSIEAVLLGEGFIQVGPAIVDRAAGHVSVQVLATDDLDLSAVSPLIQASYKASTFPASGETVNFESGNKKHTYTVTAESGETREWVIELVPFVETIPGTYKITGTVLYGGTGPEYGGGSVMNLSDKDVWPDDVGPDVELDNILTFEFVGVTPEGHTHGTVTNNAGTDGKYTDYQFVANPATDVNHFYRAIPKGAGKWLRNYTTKTITFTFADGHMVTGSFIGPQTFDFGNGNKKTVTNNSFDFTLNSADDWGNIYTDYDKIVKRPRRYWIDVIKQ